ncbi:MAG: DeoR/GlpR family DNA-binding transcription regulator [Treponema sp.]|jgi:DeoR/GlpR family transcriptional regulator of sugar metabolism|nr:DeoR/GlpR family DNA-binding transcription regulator [Treponema sp.]
MINRYADILEIITKNQRIEVTALAAQLAVSTVTIRKELAALEEQGIIRREHGYAVIGSVDDVGRRMAYHYEIKRRIAQAAVETIQDGEVVMIESGSCCAFLAEEIAKCRRDITVITNSTFIANHIRHAPHLKIVILGGDYQTESQVLVGPVTRKCVEGFFTDKLFIGIDGFTEQFGFTSKDHLRAETAQAMIKQVQQLIVLAESEKFLHHGVVELVRTKDVSLLFTDDNIPAEKEAVLRENKVQVYKVPATLKGGNGMKPGT